MAVKFKGLLKIKIEKIEGFSGNEALFLDVNLFKKNGEEVL
jgi:hypothetical protein